MAWSLFISAVLIGAGLFLIYIVEKQKKGDTYMYAALFAGALLVIAGGWLLSNAVSAAVIKRKIWGFLIMLFGGFMTFGFPGTTEYQPVEFGYTGILIGIIALVGGIYLLVF